jgi:hypothetical protein
MVNVPHLFMKLEDVEELEGIKSGLDINGTEHLRSKSKSTMASHTRSKFQTAYTYLS